VSLPDELVDTANRAVEAGRTRSVSAWWQRRSATMPAGNLAEILDDWNAETRCPTRSANGLTRARSRRIPAHAADTKAG